jgi:outer membrane lipopolysaccharide assembly protein LptE/RlpB
MKLLACLLLALLCSCPYRLVKENAAPLPSRLQSLAVPLARNQTIEAGLEDVFTQALIQRLRSDGRATVLPVGKAEAELRCKLKSLDTRTTAYTREGRTGAESVTVTVECGLVAPGSGSVAWSSGELVADEEYPVGDNYLQNEQARAAALRQVCARIADTVRALLLDPF